MPWASIFQPSAALGVLSAICHEAGFPVATLYPNMDLNAIIDPQLSYQFAHNRFFMSLGEHLFACDLFGAQRLNSDEFIQKSMSGETTQSSESLANVTLMKQLRDEVIPAFLDRLQTRVLEQNPTVVGFTATVHQVMASLALGRRLKQSCPGIQILAGGASFDDEMGREYHRAFRDILDHVFLGEADESFPEYLRRRRTGKPKGGIPGVTYWEAGQVQCVPGRPLADWNLSPMPDYDGYFAEKERVEQQYEMPFAVDCLLFESSRGCWWGQKKHCVFCGMNEDFIKFREKDPDRVVSEIISLSKRHQVIRLMATDSIISRKSRSSIFRKLSALQSDLEFVYITRSDMTKEEIALAHSAGVASLQAGIESFSTELLHLMGKSMSRIRQVQFLRWCREYGIAVLYSILTEFPGDDTEWYLTQAEFLPQIVHLNPPMSNFIPVALHRFSPLFTQSQRFGITPSSLQDNYHFNFPSGFIDLNKIIYSFAYQSSKATSAALYDEQLRSAIFRWIEKHITGSPPTYVYRLGTDFVQIDDLRGPKPIHFTCKGLSKDILLLADRIQTVNNLKTLLAPKYASDVAGGTIEKTIENMVCQKILMQEGNSVLTLPVGSEPRTTTELYDYVLGHSAVAHGATGLNSLTEEA